jgi:hypothetical protein
MKYGIGIGIGFTSKKSKIYIFFNFNVLHLKNTPYDEICAPPTASALRAGELKFSGLRFGQSLRTCVSIPPRFRYFNRVNSFFVEGASTWNSLPLEIRSARSAETFKKSYYSSSSTRQ